MKKFIVLLVTVAFVASMFATAFAQTSAKATSDLAANLPASDGAMKINMARLANDALPQMLQSKPQFLSEMNSKIDEIKAKTGIDLRQFEEVAVGFTQKKLAPKNYVYDPVILARGKFDASAMMGIAKLASKGKYREEKIGERIVYVFPAKDIVENNRPQNSNPKVGKAIDSLTKKMTEEIALASFDQNTLAMGSKEQLMKIFTESKSRISNEMLGYLNRKQNSVMSFAMNLPEGGAQFADFEMDEIGKNLNAIRKAYGSMDYADGMAVMTMTAATETAPQATSLEEMVKGLQMLGKVFLGNTAAADKKIYSSMIEKVAISRQNNEVTLDLKATQAEINSLMGVIIK